MHLELSFLIAAMSCYGFGAQISLKNAYDLAAIKNESIQIKAAEFGAAEERVSQAFGKILPNVSLIGTYARQDGFSELQRSARANLTQPLFHGFSEFAQYNALKALARSEKASAWGKKLDLYASTATAYYDLLLSQVDLATLNLLADLTKKRVSDIRSRAKIGRSKKGDLLAAEAQALTLASELEEAKGALRTAEEQFTLIVGIPGPHSLEPVTELPEKVIVKSPPTSGPSPELLKTIENRPDYVSANEEAIAADEIVSVAKGSHYPQLDFSGNYYFDRTGTLKDSKWDLGITITIPLFAGGSTQATVREALELHKAKTLRVEFTKRDAEKEIRTLSELYESLLSQYGALKQAAELSDLNYKEQSKDYRYGLVTNLEVLQAMNTLQETRRKRDRTFYKALKTSAQLAAATGTHPFEKAGGQNSTYGRWHPGGP